MTKKIGDKKIGGVESTREMTKVEGTEGVSGVEGVKKTSGVSGVGGVQGVSKRRPTRVMSFAEREQLFSMIQEEADKMFANANLSEEQRKVVTDAVKMAVDAGIVGDEDDVSSKKS